MLTAIGDVMRRVYERGLGKDGTLAFDIVGQADHGVCAVATDPWAAYEHIERLDHICEMVLKSGATDTSPKNSRVGNRF